MKFSWEKPPNNQISRQTALGFLATNAAVPGVGTMLSGRYVSGALQALLGFAGLALSLVYGVRLLTWMFANWSRLQDPYADPWNNLVETWRVIRLPLLGLVLFGVSWLWAITSSLIYLRRLPKVGSGQTHLEQ
jgi:hypothetical protein